MPDVPSAAPEVSRKRGADPGPLPEHAPGRKKACWGILTSQGWLIELQSFLKGPGQIAPLSMKQPLRADCLPCTLHSAGTGNSQCVESLLSHGADPDYEVSHLGSPLYMSCLHQHTACSKILLHRGASVNVGRGRDSPLHAAVRQDCADQVSVLLDYGADVNMRDSNNQRAVELAPPGGKTQQLLLTFEVSPRSLCQLCRLQIRNLIGRSRLSLLPLLPLPSLLTHYLEHTPEVSQRALLPADSPQLGRHTLRTQPGRQQGGEPGGREPFPPARGGTPLSSAGSHTTACRRVSTSPVAQTCTISS
ncbi:hypothetical protein L3Q82_005192 [Scortum barcoo]|uniref:Uncharacterized protein n=1 Tax=Scortum barcoo TaxID=214431 RepID=A0ACB8V9V9_9TELE|nr:hypothetical protein L3Q82_005192 [Scortum barcoo]